MRIGISYLVVDLKEISTGFRELARRQIQDVRWEPREEV